MNSLNITAAEMNEIRSQREAEYAAEIKNAKSALAAYWAGSVSASVARDYKAGRVRKVGK